MPILAEADDMQHKCILKILKHGLKSSLMGATMQEQQQRCF
jgi:hypothetical protein